MKKENRTTMCCFCDRVDAIIMNFGPIDYEKEMDREEVLTDKSTSTQIKCKTCGKYKIIPINTRLHADPRYEEYRENAFLISGFIRYENMIDKIPTIDVNPEELEQLLNHLYKYKDLENRITSFITLIKDYTEYYGHEFELSSRDDYPLSYAKNEDEFYNIINECSPYIEIPLTSFEGDGHFSCKLKLTREGFQYLKEKNPLSKQVFIAMQLNKKAVPYPVNIYHMIETKVREETGFNLFWMMKSEDMYEEPINDKIIAEIRRSRLVIADVTHLNPNVMYEAGYAKGFGLDVLYTCEKSKFAEYRASRSIPFDTGQYNHHEWEEGKEIEYAERIIDFIRARY